MSSPTTTDPSLDRHYMQKALEMARRAFDMKEVPVGAVIVHQNHILASAWNRRESLQDPTAHAELLIIQEAAQLLGSWRLTDTTLYVTLEPCPMCAGAIMQSRIPRIVFGTKDPKAGACGSVCDLSTGYPFNHRFEVTSGVLENDCRHILKNFFEMLREAQSVRG